MELEELIDRAAAVISLLSVLGIFLLLPLYLSQRRDLLRLQSWRESEPDYPRLNVESSEERLDQAEVELAKLLGTGETSGAMSSAAARVTHERPALTRVTMEREALVPHPRWRRFLARASQPRVLVPAGIVALLIAGGAIVLSEELLSGDGGDSTAKGGRIERGDVTVAVLNGTSVSGLAGTVASDVEASGYQIGTVAGTTPDFEKMVVLYAQGQKAAAQKVAKDLGLDPKLVEPIDREARLLAGGADVVVIAGEDRIQP